MLFRFSQGQSFGYLRGVVMILLGLALLFSPEFTLVSIARLVATLFIVKGALAGISLLLSRGGQRNPGLLLECIIDLGIGLLVLYNPGGTVSFFVVILAIWALLGGLLMAFSFNTLRRVGVTNWGLFMSSIIALSFGLVLLFEPLQGGVALATIIGAFSLVYGIANIISVASGRTM
ncbi:HdeD family acid-resistance protein [Sunxiuqinia elliptica]|uniref:Uncharacterized membrane protein HdeD (DUF308 family) n=1 Tax=Sunxiuqinia elliptica TaxID=655355 RepID=A0A4R6H8J2_9BACT|nr:DUF308 domain-containing protein [Sunxiuqinia elliptica]TDO04733.1 uncharacterized membrane protein HdeD (DUF308 family) [Sunxiuqinia elliptica]TDO64281.1 uncharacterized membrane protein HdeD (DUF308 family) [Sunxiuqinia elliptica]